MKPMEKDIQAAICDYLTLKRVFFWRNNSTPIFDPDAQCECPRGRA